MEMNTEVEVAERDGISEALKKHNAFFAFSNEQYEKEAIKDVIYVSLGCGLICPKASARQLGVDIKSANSKATEEDLKTNTKKEIIHRELANHEAQITGDIDDTVSALVGYGITDEEIQTEYKVFFDNCVKHDLF